MKVLKRSLKFIALTALVFVSFTGCESTDGGGNVSGSVYYGVGFYDPWYYGGYYDDDVDIIVTPPERPDRPVPGPHPERPIAKPPSAAPRPRPMPSIPSTPRVAPRGGGRR
jgi:hypothetical protein